MACESINRGATVVRAVCSESRLESLVDELTKRGRASATPTDVRSWDDVQPRLTDN